MSDPAQQPVPAAAAAATVPAASAFDLLELRRTLARPHTILEIVLAERARLVATVRRGANLGVLVAVLVATSIACTAPFAMVRNTVRAADIAILFLGSTLLCFPSLQVFSSYLGVRASLLQNLVLALLVPATAALFCFGFFPIYWFLDLTMSPESAVPAHAIAILLLTVSLALGLGHLDRCLLLDRAFAALRSSWWLLAGWQLLLVFITYRMALALYNPVMLRSLATLVTCAAAYGFTIGASNSWTYAVRDVVKFPLLILITSAVCALSYFVLARFLGTPLSFLRVQRLVLAVFRDLSVLLASLGPVVLFLGLCMTRPSHEDLADYPMFQGLNVAFIALCGCLAVRRQGGLLLRDHGLVPGLRNALVAGWMLLSLFAGGQAAWYMRPFFGIDPPGPEGVAWCFGTEPDFRGARSIYEAVWNLVALPSRR